jgi:hypothetical protein
MCSWKCALVWNPPLGVFGENASWSMVIAIFHSIFDWKSQFPRIKQYALEILMPEMKFLEHFVYDYVFRGLLLKTK